ncbi:poly(ADP-ribose) glycohydrolase 1-like [Salvia miltiorrhiza]|uniref:poly(ADP-ribose) glycohydrolase 1-like n=1 Tax=Salvia miltiorrhiza TaxID=226208 RepID=UPI0025AB997B|nr:poly(ADP-ribose) glycohydrolase 1-like [Salvia miltiorrhiza]XP_057781234.1 poly(ADP-ribose) glycohydrolase 1-like [Salvia miltiorrhiza]
MENREDFLSILPYLPLILRSSAVFWPPSVVEALKSLSKGPSHSNVNSGQLFALAVSDLRSSLGEYTLFPSASLGFSLFFDDLMSKDEAGKWFTDVVPRLSDLLLRLPELLETHYQNAGSFCGMETGLRLLESQQPGIVLLSQELIAALLVCALFCLFPTTNRRAEHLPPINFDNLFACLYECYDVNQEHKIKCLVHYFETICLTIPLGNVSFERKVLPLKNSRSHIAYPEPDFWSKSTVSLCQFKVHNSGLIEDQSVEALEVDFANKYIGGGALSRGCVQEEIRFLINPELIVSMLFLPSMADNEAIEIVGAQRFSNYSGYAKSFRFCGHHEDNKSVDAMGRRKTRIIAIDALCSPGKRQYRLDCLLRETNKAFCGFLDQQKHQLHQNLFHESKNSTSTTEDLPASSPAHEQSRHNLETQNIKSQSDQRPSHDAKIGIATGNWGCGAFGGDPEIKAVIQWLAASQTLRPFILYYTFSIEPLQKLELVVQWILAHGWSVGELWSVLVEYSTQRGNGEARVGFFKWLLPSLHVDDPMVLDMPGTM